jgi:hypothetical protein
MWAGIAEVYFIINLEPHIHFSKSLSSSNRPTKIPPNAGQSADKAAAD